MTCETVRRLVHDAHDDDSLGTVPESVREHLAACASCRELNADLAALSAALRALPRVPLPAETLEAVWRDTIHARHAGSANRATFWRLAAAAVFVMALSTATFYLIFSQAPPALGPSPIELARASAQAEMVLGYTARALAATRIAATERVLASRVSPAVRGDAATHASTKSSRRPL
jgi:predicted anti-sigma-YlaC factor YlaD